MMTKRTHIQMVNISNHCKKLTRLVPCELFVVFPVHDRFIKRRMAGITILTVKPIVSMGAYGRYFYSFCLSQPSGKETFYFYSNVSS